MTGSSPSDDLLQKAYSLWAAGQPLDALKLCLPRAEAGDTDCAKLVGWIYSKGGPSVDKNLREARRWLTLASENGDPLATYLLGTSLCADGNATAAVPTFLRAGEQGISAAFYQLGKMYELGLGVTKDKEQAYQYYRRAADEGHIFARREVASMLIKGHRGAIGRLVGIPIFVMALVAGTYTAVTDPYGEKTYE